MTRHAKGTPMAKGGAAVDRVTGVLADRTDTGVPAHGSPSIGHDRWPAGTAVLIWTAVSALGWLVIAALAVLAV